MNPENKIEQSLIEIHQDKLTLNFLKITLTRVSVAA